MILRAQSVVINQSVLNLEKCLQFTSMNILSGVTRYLDATPLYQYQLRKLKYLPKYELRKQLAETLILSKLDYADLVFYPLPQFLLRRLQQVQFAAASFVLGHYVKNFRDELKIEWLPINERSDLNLLKSSFKALHNTETWPDYFKIIKQKCRKELRSSNSIRLVVLTENGTFQDNASKLFNNLPETIRNCKDYRTFLSLSSNFLCNGVQNDKLVLL